MYLFGPIILLLTVFGFSLYATRDTSQNMPAAEAPNDRDSDRLRHSLSACKSAWSSSVSVGILILFLLQPTLANR